MFLVTWSFKDIPSSTLSLTLSSINLRSICGMEYAVCVHLIRATSHMRLRARDQHFSSTLIGGKGGASQVRFTLHLKDQRSTWMQDGCKVYMDSYMASNGSCFMVPWTVFKNHLLEVGLIQNQDIMALWTSTIIGLSYFIMWGPYE